MSEQISSLLPTSHAAYITRRRFGNLDGIRFICIVMVLWHHASPLSSQTLQLFGRGFLGVDFFFILSGFLITTLLLRETEASGQFSMRNFYIRRFLRIVPVYFFVVTLMAVLYIGVKGETQYLEILPYYYLFLSNFLTTDIPGLGITWSLSVEEQYYLVWPLLMVLLPIRWLLPVCAALVVVNVLNAMGAFGVAPIPLGPLLIRPPTATYAPILMGSGIAILLHRSWSYEVLQRIAGARFASVTGCVALVVFMQFGPTNVVGWPNLVIHSLMSYILIALLIREDSPLTPFLAHRFVARFGAVSYGIYLYHLLALDVVLRGGAMIGGLSPWLVFLFYMLLSYGIAELSFRTLEAYFQKFRPKS